MHEDILDFEDISQGRAPNEITKRLGIKPSSTSVAGERKILGKPCVNGWFLCTRGKIKSKDSRRHIDWVLDKIEPVIEEILALKKKALFLTLCASGALPQAMVALLFPRSK